MTLIIPYFAFAILSELIFSTQNNFSAHQSMADFKNYAFAVRNTLTAGSLWFLPCLFIIVVLYRLALILIKNKYIILIIAFILACLFNISKPAWFWNADSALAYLVYYSIGHISFPIINKYRYYLLNIKGKVIYILLVLISVLFTVMTYLKVLDIFFFALTSKFQP